VQTLRLEGAAVSGVVSMPTNNSKFVPDLHDIEDSSHAFFVFLIFIYTVVSVWLHILGWGFFVALLFPQLGNSYTSDKSNSYKEVSLQNALCCGVPVSPSMPHLRPVSHSPDIAFRIVLTVLCFFRSCGQNTFLAGIGAPHSPMPYSLTTLHRALLEKDIFQVSTKVI